MAEPVPAVTLFGVAAVLGLFGYFIRFQRRLYLVAGFDPDRADRATLANLVGGLLLFVAVLTLVLGLAAAMGRSSTTLWSAYTVAVLVATAVAAVASRVTAVRAPGPANGERE